MAYSQSELLKLMDGWRDINLSPEDINQPKEYQQIRNHYLQNVSATPQGPGTPALSYGQNTWGAVQEGGRQIGEDVSDMAVGIADFFGADEWAEEKRRERAVYDKISQEYGGWAREGYDPNRAVIDLPGEAADIRARHLESAVRSAPATLAAVGGGVLTGGLLPAGMAAAGAGTAARLGGMALSAAPTVGGMTAMSGVVYPQFFEQALREGLDRGRASEQAFVYTLAEVFGEALPIGKILSRTPGARSFAREILSGIAAETAGEYITEFGQMAYDMARKGEDVTSDEFWSRMNDVWKVSVLMAGGTQAPVASAKAIADRLIEADPEYIRQLMTSEGARLGYDPKAIVSDPTLESRSGYETEGAVDLGTKKMIFSPELIKGMAREKAGKVDKFDSKGNLVKVTRQDVKNRVNSLLMHEAGTHGGLFSFFATGKGGDVKSFNEYLEKFYEQNKAEVDAWLETDERGLAYPTGKGDAYDTPVNRVNEFVAINIGEKTNTGLIRGIISKAKLLLKKNTGYDYSPNEARDLIRSAHMSMQMGTLSPEVAAKPSAVTQESKVAQFPDRKRQVATERAMATNEDVRFGDNRMQSIQEDWKNNELDLRREYDDFEAFEEAEWDLNYETWLDERGDTVLESRTGEPADPSRRKFMKQVGGAAAGIAADPRMILEPATPTAVEAPMYTGMKEVFPGSIYEFSIATDPNAGWTSSDDPGEGDMDVSFTHDPNTNEVTVYEDHKVVDTFEVDDMHADAEVLDYVRDKYGRKNINDVRVQREEMERDPVTGEGGFDYWGDADENFDNMAASLIRGEKTMAGVERVERGPAYDYFDEPETPRLPERETPRLPEPKVSAIEKPTQKALPAPEETTEKTDAELYVETIDEIMNIYDEDATAAEAAQDGTLNDRIISYAAETPFTREELWEGVNQRIEALEEPTPERLESRVRKPKTETVQRDINEEAKKARNRINALDIGEDEKTERRSLLKRLQNVMGAPARKRGINAGNQDVFVAQAATIVDGDLTTVEEFITPFEEQITPSSERVHAAAARRDQRAKRLGKTDAEILKYRPKGGKHPMEGRMTYPFAKEEIDRQEEAGEITAEEAEIRRLAVNNVRRIFKGRAGPTVKRTITEAVYGIGAYEDLVPWSEVYTEEQAEEMGERAEVAEAEARRTRYDPTDITEKQKQDLLKDPVIAEEAAWIASEEMSSIKGSEERLLFLRAPAEFKSEAEQKEFQVWRKNQRDFDAAEYKKQQAQERDKMVAQAEKEGKGTVIPPVDTKELQKESRRTLEQVDPSVFDTMVTQYGTDYANALERAGFNYDSEGNLIDETEGEITSGAEVVDNTKLESRVRSKRTGAEGELQILDVPEEMGGQIYDRVIVTYKKGDKTPALHYATEDEIEVITEEDADTDKRRQKARTAKSDETGNLHYRRMRNIYEKLNKVLDLKPRQKPEREHLLNTTPVVKETGEITKESEIAPNAVWNLVLMPKFLHDIKSTFEGGRTAPALATHRKKNGLPQLDSGERFQSSAPYFDISNMVDRFDKNEITEKDFEKYGITLREARQVKKFRDAIKKSLNDSTEANLFQKFADAYTSALGIETINVKDVHITLEENQALKGLIDTMAIKVQPPKSAVEATPARSEAEIMGDNATVGPTFFSRVDAKRIKDKGSTYSEHFNDSFWYRATSFLWGKPVQAIRDFNKTGRFGTERADIKAADQIADLFQRHQSAKMRAEGMETGTDFVQDVSLRTGEFYSKLSKIFAEATDRLGVLTKVPNGELVDFLVGKDVKFSDPAVKKAAEQLRDLMDGVYKYAKDETSGLETPLDLRGEGDSLLPRVWNIEYLATRSGKAKLLRTLSDMFSEREGGKPIFEDADITVEDMYDIIINSGGFVQGDWTNLKADQTRSEKDIEKDLKIQEYLDMLDTETLIDGGLVLDDLQAVIPRFIQKAVERTEYAKRFGTNDEILRGLIGEGIDQIREHNREVLKLKKDAKLSHIDEKRFAKSAWDMARIARNKYGYDMANMPTRRWIQRITNAATIMKLPLVALASMPEFFTPMLKGDVSPHHWFVDLMAATTWAGYKGMNGISKLLLNQHLPAMRKMSRELGGSGVLSDIQLLREMGIADIQAMGDLVSTRYANPNFARGGLRAGAGGSIAGKIPKHVRGVFNMQTFMQATMLTTMTEMQQLMALRNYQRHVSKRIDFVQGNKGKTLSGRKARIFKQYTQDLLDYGITGDIDLKTSSGEAAFNAGALRFIDQVITRPNDATTAKAFKNPLISPLVLFKRFITTFGNTLITSVGNDFAHSVSNVERAKVVGKVGATAMAMYGAVMFSEIIRGAIKGDLDEDDFKAIPGDFNQFVRRLDRTGLLSAPGTMAVNIAFPYKRGWWDSTEARIVSEALGPLGGDLTTFGDTLLDPKKNGWKRLLGQLIPTTKPFLGGKKEKEVDTRQTRRRKQREQLLKRRKERREARG